jgi:hypothetical protein
MWNELTIIILHKNEAGKAKENYKFPYILAFTYNLQKCVLVSTSLYSDKYQLPIGKSSTIYCTA